MTSDPTFDPAVEVDVSTWEVIDQEQGGRDPGKLWLARTVDDASTHHWLWKPRRRTGGGVWAANDVAEVVASRLATWMHLPAADCHYAVRHGEVGAISRNVTPAAHDLHDGGTYLAAVAGYRRRSLASGGRVRRDHGYTLAAIEQVLDGLPGPPGWKDYHATDLFAGYLVFDAWVANGDRHPQNWALLEDQRDGALALAPTFDHGSALGSGLTDRNRRNKDTRAWCARGRANPFTPPEPLVDLARRAMAHADAHPWMEAALDLDQASLTALLDAPTGRMSDACSTFISEVLVENGRRLIACRPRP